MPQDELNNPEAREKSADPNALVARAKDLLTLAEHDRRGAEEAFALLGFDQQLETALALTGDELQEWLTLSEDCTELVRSLPPEHLHQAIRLIGEEDALAMLAAASSEQMQAMLDVEWYTDNKLDRRKVRYWIELFMEVNIDEVDEALQAIDPNAMAEFLRRSVKPKIDKEHLLLAIHLNQAYLFTPEDLDTNDELIERFLHYMYAVDREYFGEILELLVAEDEQVVEADMYAGREDRMIQRGFPALAKAEALLETLDIRLFGVDWPDLKTSAEGPTTEIAQARPRAPFLLHAIAYARAMNQLSERTERAFIRETAELGNSLLLAHAHDAGSPGIKKEALCAIQVISSVGLEAATKGHVIAAFERLKAMDTIELFRLGWSLIRTTAKAAWDLVYDYRIEKADLGRNLRWLPPHLGRSVRDAEELMSWRRIGATYQLPEDEKERKAYVKTPPQELLTWPRLCNLRAGVLLAQEELDIQVLAKMVEKGPGE